MKNTILSSVLFFLIFNSLFSQHTWLQQETTILKNLQAVSFISENTGVAVGDDGTIISTSDGGETWLPAALGVSADLFGVDFANEMKVFAVGTGGSVLVSENQGESWEIFTIPGVSYDLLDVAFHMNSGYGVITGQGNAIIVTSDFGNTWAIVQDGYMSTFYSALMASENVGVVIGWNSIFQPLLGYTLDWQTWDYCNFYPTWGGVMYEGRANGGKFLSENEGFIVGVYFVPGGGFLAPFGGWGNNSWDAQTFPEQLLDIDISGQFGVVTGTNGYLAESQDGGLNWEMINLNLGNFQLNDVYLTGNTGYIVGEMGLMLKLTSTVGVSENQSGELRLSCYPNPCRDVLHLEIENPDGHLTLEIMDATGSFLARSHVSSGIQKVALPVRNLASGMYFLKITGDGVSQTLRFSKD